MTATRSRVAVLGIAVWVVAIAAGIHALLKYETTPGAVAAIVDRWPAGTSLARDPAKPTLVMLVHPNCPCSRASLAELAELMGRAENALTAYVVFVRPNGLVDDPATADLWRTAIAIPGVKAVPDPGAILATQFRAQTSGEVFFYDPGGTLRFSGGITESRGHEGDNAGRSAIEEFLHGGTISRARTPVFGCYLK